MDRRSFRRSGRLPRPRIGRPGGDAASLACHARDALAGARRNAPINQLEPGRRRLALGFETVDRLFPLQRQTDIVEAVEQAVLAERVDVEFDATAIRAGDLLLVEIDGDDGIGAALGVVHQLVDIRLLQRDRQDAVLEAVVVEDVGEARRDDAGDAEIEERPGRVLAARAAAEIFAGDEDLGLAIGRLVEDEIGVFGAVVTVAHLVEQRLAEPHSPPASGKMRSSPSSSAWCLPRPEPGTTIAAPPGAPLRPLAMRAASRMSSMRPLVHEPMKTRCTLMSASLVPASSPI